MTDTTDSNPFPAPPLPHGLWPTQPTRDVMDAIEACRTSGDIGLVTGPSGVGKTTAALAAVAVAAADGRRARYVRMSATSAGLQPGLLRIGAAVGAYVEAGMGASAAYEAVRGALCRSHLGDVLVIDEAQYMSDDLICAVRDLADELRGEGWALGIVLLGDGDLAARIGGKSGRGARRFEPLHGRLGIAQPVLPPDAADFRAIADNVGVAQPQAADLLARVGAGRGGLHNLARTLATAREIAGPGNPLTLAALRTAAQARGVAQ